MLKNLASKPRTSVVSSTELSEFFGPHRAPGRDLSEFRRRERLHTPKNLWVIHFEQNYIFCCRSAPDPI